MQKRHPRVAGWRSAISIQSIAGSDPADRLLLDGDQLGLLDGLAGDLAGQASNHAASDGTAASTPQGAFTGIRTTGTGTNARSD
jgi:hypothetical protein